MDLDGLEVVATSAHSTVAAAPGLMMGRFWATVTAAEVDALRRGLLAATKESDQCAAMLIISEDGAAPDREMRRRLGETIESFHPKLIALAGVVEGDDVTAGLKRTMMRLIMTIARVRCANTVTSTVAAGAEWLRPQLNHMPKHLTDPMSLGQFATQHLPPPPPQA